MIGSHLEESKHSNIWVLGNGESRRNVDLSSLDYTIGCNAIHRDHVCNEIVAVDRRMVREITSNPKYTQTTIYTRPDWVKEFSTTPNVVVVPKLPYKGCLREDDPWHWNSGPFAVLVACLKSPSVINLLGFDLYSTDKKLNNIYKDTSNYGKESDHPIDHRYWVHQLYHLFMSFPKIQFVQWQHEPWAVPELWKTPKNLTFNTIRV